MCKTKMTADGMNCFPYLDALENGTVCRLNLALDENLVQYLLLGFIELCHRKTDVSDLQQILSTVFSLVSRTFLGGGTARTDGLSYLSFRIPRGGDSDACLCFARDVGDLQDIYDLFVEMHCHFGIGVESELKAVASMICKTMSSIVVTRERRLVWRSSHMTAQQFFMDSATAESIAIAATRVGVSEAEFDEHARELWSVYREVLQAPASEPESYLSLLYGSTQLISLSELQNPFMGFEDAVRLRYGVSDYANMPIGSLSITEMGRHVAAGILLDDIWRNVKAASLGCPTHTMPEPVLRRAKGLFAEDYCRNRITLLAGDDGLPTARLARFLSEEKSEFLA